MIFEGMDLKVVAAPTEDRTLLVVTFTGREQVPPAAQGAGELFLAKNGLSAVHVISKANHWWQTPEFGPALAAVRRYADDNRYIELVTYGSSMGGFGALTAAGRLCADRVLASVPQFSIDPAVVEWESRWIKDARKITFLKEQFGDLVGTADIIIMLDTLFVPDARHASLIAAHVPTRTIAVPFADHDVSRVLAEMGLLSEVTLEALRGRYDKVAFQARQRVARRRSPLIWSGAARLLAERNKLHLARLYNQRAVDMLLTNPPERIRPEQDRVISFHQRLLLEAGNAGEALAMLDRWALVKTFGWHEFMLLAQVHASQNDPRAIQAIALAVRDRPSDRQVLTEYVRIVAALASPHQAETLVAQVMPNLLAQSPLAIRAARMLQARNLDKAARRLAAAVLAKFPDEAHRLGSLATDARC